MKKLFALLLALAMVFSLATVAFADGTETTDGEDSGNSTTQKGSITINGVSETTTYTIYRILDLESYDVSAGAYAYKANSDWEEFLETEQAKKYLKTDADGYVTWINAANDDDTVATFAKGALSYAKEMGIDPVKSSKNSSEFVITGTTGVFSDLPLGYYLVDSTVGALCGLTTTNPAASINAKNGIPTIDKQVVEDSTNQWADNNTADIGQIVDYRVTVNVHAGAENYVLHDVMDAGLTYQSVIQIEHVIPGTETHYMDAKDYTVYTADSVDTEGNKIITDGCDFEIHFTKEICDKLETNDKLVITYKAMLNRNAVIAGNGNVNKAWLAFGEGNKSNEDTVITRTYAFDLIKTDSQNTLIDGAEFRIYDAEAAGKEVGVVLMDDDVTYRRAREDEQEDGKTVNIIVKDGKARVVGLDNGTYYLEEVVAPDGYNKLTARQKFIISDGNLDAIFNDGIYSTGSGVHVVNKNGTMLPETGAMGTSMFLFFGTFAVLAAGVLLVTKKRMSMIED